MRKRHILGFFDALVRSPAFLFLCAMFLCGALAGGLTGLHASEGDNALHLTALLAGLPEQAAHGVVCAVLWVLLPPLCMLLRPPMLFLSGVCAARGFVLALMIAVSIGDGADSLLLSLCTAGIPALLSVPALLAACAITWQQGEWQLLFRNCGGPYLLCLLMAAISALLRAAFALLWGL